MFTGSEIQYRLTNQSSRLSSRSNSHYEFAITEENRAKLDALVKEEFDKELARVIDFETINEPGPEALLLMIYLSDVVLNVPPQTRQRRDIYLSEVGSTILTLELPEQLTPQLRIHLTTISNTQTM